MDVGAIIQLPWTLIQLPLSGLGRLLGLARVRKKSHVLQVSSLPVGGLDDFKAQSVALALKQASQQLDVKNAADDWLMLLQLAQTLSNRLLLDMRKVERNCDFWRRRLQIGGNRFFMLLARGPTSFVRDVLAWLGYHKAQHPRHLSATDNIEQRIVLLRSVQSLLATALSEVHAHCVRLQLSQSKHSRAHTPQDQQHVNMHVDYENGDAARKLVAMACDAMWLTSVGVRDTLRALIDKLNQLCSQPDAAVRKHLEVVLLKHTLQGSSTHLHALAGPPMATNGAWSGPGQPSTALTEVQKSGDMHAAIAEIQSMLHLTSPLCPASSARAASIAAAQQASRMRQIVDLPTWVRAPSKLQQHWLRNVLLAVPVMWGTVFLVRHSPLVGSDDLQRWCETAALAVLGAFNEHAVKPLQMLRAELFHTLRSRPSIVSQNDYEASKQSFDRMLEDFERDHLPRLNAAGGAKGGDGRNPGELRGMDLLMWHYEQELRRPIINILTGALARSLLIQVQKLKLDGEAAMMEMDQILRSNELSITLVAATPALLFAAGSLAALHRWLKPRPPDPLREALPCRMLMVHLERAVQQNLKEGPSAELDGAVKFHTSLVHEEAARLFARFGRLGGGGMSAVASEWPNLSQDLLELASSSTGTAQLRACKRIMQLYSIFNAATSARASAG